MQSRGSEWRQWDLHFHTPSSYDYGDKSITNQDIVNVLRLNNISVFAVTDHHIIDIERYRDLKKRAAQFNINVLPGIEFLSDARGSQPVHFIAIFSENSNLEYIWGQIQNKTAISRIVSEKKKPNEVYCNLIETITLVKDLGGIVTIHSGQKHGTIENITNSLEHSMAQKIDIANIVDIYELGKIEDQVNYRTKVFPFLKGKLKNKESEIPMIICSDNHNIKKYEIKEKMWIKGDPSFEGLKYALSEPVDRFYIGSEPAILKKVRENKTKYIDSLSIKLSGAKDETNIWFDNIVVPLNCELVTIIGNKGNGKSAIADIISMCMDGENSQDYSFLNKGKFIEKGLAERFSGSVGFISSSSTEERRLDYKIDSANERKVKYLPQSYFEKICNEIGKVEAFRKEIEKVVFQYIAEQNKFQKVNFQDLLSYRRETIDKQILSLKNDIIEKNNKIIDVEDKLDPIYLKNLKSKLKIKNEEIESHIKNLPTIKNVPDTYTSQANLSNELTPERIELDKLKILEIEYSHNVKEIRENISSLIVKCNEVQKVIDELSILSNGIDEFIKKNNALFVDLELDISGSVKVIINTIALEKMIASIEMTRAKLENELVVQDIDEKIEDLNALSKLQKVKKNIAIILEKLSEEERDAQKILQEKKEWELKKEQLIGDMLNADSQVYLLSQIHYVENIAKNDLIKLRKERSEISVEIFKKKHEIKKIYDEVKTEIDKIFADGNEKTLKIVSEFHTSDVMERNLFNHIRQNKAGTFYGTEDSSTYFRENIIAGLDWNSSKDIVMFQDRLIDCIENDYRNIDDVKSTPIVSILKDRNKFYEYLYGLEYLEPHYSLKQNGKNLEQLSPGEKGALLLVFYLVLDKDDIPLIIDQPEDNLDNSSIADILVPYIRKAKSQRQIIMVTHNPNLAVVADSEQVIRVSIDKSQGNKFSFVSGGIEQLDINNAILDVLEGKAPAFKKRKIKYQSI